VNGAKTAHCGAKEAKEAKTARDLIVDGNGEKSSDKNAPMLWVIRKI